MKKGLFITFEGADGCGKTTQIELLKTYLDKNNIASLLTREPGSGDLGLKLREILLHYDKPIADNAEVFMYLADRAQHTEYEIVPFLNKGGVVLCDRFIDSTISYQGYGRGLDINMLENLNNIATKGLKPDLTIVFDIDTKIAQNRINKRCDKKDRLEEEGLEFHKKLRTGYLEIAKKNPDRIKVINADDSIENIHKKVMELFLEIKK